MNENAEDALKIHSDVETPKALNYIEKLVAELCPDGVEYVEISELFDTKNGYTPSKSIPSYWQDGEIPWFRMEDIRVNGRVLNDSLKHVHKSAVKNGKIFPQNSIIFATSATIGEHALIKVPFLCNQRFTALSVKNKYLNKVNIKFLFYYGFILDEWCKSNTTQSSFASVDMKGFKKFKFPLPPLEIQNAIVEILDKFTKLEAELEAELAARRAQYEYYRNLLYENLIDQVPKVELGKFATLNRGHGMPKSDFVETGVGAIHYGQIYTKYGFSANSTLAYVSEESARKLTKVNPGDLVVTNTSENINDVCKAVAWIGDEDIVTGGHSTVVTQHFQNPKYLSYYFSTNKFNSDKKKYAFGTKVIDVSPKNLAKIKIPLPPLAEQERIVKILDKFDALVNDISSGLPAEIEARRKQYEYYRDRLLTFPCASESTEHKH